MLSNAPNRIFAAMSVLGCTVLLASCRDSESAHRHVLWWKPWERFHESAPPPVGADIVIRWKGNRVFPDRALRKAIEEQISQIRAEGLTRPNADDSAYYTAVHYHQNGYAHAEVDWQIAGKELVLTVREGPRVQLGSMQIEGNVNIPSATLLELLTSASAERLKRSAPHLPLVREDIESGASRIADRYRSEGFLDVHVRRPEISFDTEGTTAAVHITMEEGKQYLFGALLLRGQLIYPEEQLRALVAPLMALPFTPARVRAIESAVEKFYANRAHFSPRIQLNADASQASDNGRVPVTIEVNPGPPSRFESVEITGLQRLRESWIRDRLHSLEGAPYDPEKLSSKQQELLSSGLFDDLRISPILQKDQTIKLNIEAREARAKELSFSAGFGNYEGVLGEIRASDRNLFGRGLQGSVALAASQRALGLEATVIDPWLFETRTQLLTRIFLRNRVERGYDKREGGIRAELSRRLFPMLTTAIFGQVRSVEVTASDLPVESIGPTAYQVATFGISGIYDQRDSILNPTSGWVAGVSADSHSTQTGQAWVRTTGRLTIHYPLPYRIRFAASGRFGVLSANSEVPIDERFFLGGSTTVRSFQERALGKAPDQVAPLGGSSFGLINCEADFPVWNKLRGAIFFDAGSLSPKGIEIPTSHYRRAIGLGARYALPVGPVRLDVGLNPSPAAGEPRSAANLSFGFAF